MTTNIIEFGRIYKEDLAQGDTPETVILADGQPMLMHPLLNSNGEIAGSDIELVTPTYGGTGQDFSLAIGQPDIVNGVWSVSRCYYNVMSFGAVGDGVTDDTAAIALAIMNCLARGGGIVYFPTGIYKTTGIAGPASNMHFRGAGPGATTIKSSVNNAPVFTIANGTSYASISDMTIDRTPAAVAGGYGISTPHTPDTAVVTRIALERLIILNHWNGLYLGPTDFSIVRDVLIDCCYNHGIVMMNAAQMGALGWTLDHTLVELCDGSGYVVNGVTMTSTSKDVPLGEWKNVSTFANSGAGIAILGNADCKIGDFRLGGNSFIGNDGSSAIYLDTYGGSHKIADTFIEGIGQSLTGRTYTTPVSNVGNGIEITANNNGVTITGCTINGCSYHGILTGASSLGASTRPTVVTGCSISNNGTGGTAANSGICLDASSPAGLVVSGGYLGDWGSGTQDYGITAGTDLLYCTGCLFRGNVVAKINWAVGAHPDSIIDAMAT